MTELAKTNARDALEDLKIRCEYDAPLGPLTWYKLGGPAEVLAHPSSIAQLAALVERCAENHIPTYILGGGANLLIADAGVPGVVIQLDDPAFQQYSLDDNVLTVGAGFDLFKLVLQSARDNMAGLEVLAGIPGTVGGAVRMNAGGAFGDIGSSVRRVQVMSANGQTYFRDRDDLVFSYRKTNIVAPFILGVEFELVEEDPQQLMRRVKEIFFYKKSHQPMGAKSAGCAFKNPPASVGATAGQLIDRAGLKGYAVGRASVSDVHANFIVVQEGAKASDVLGVIEHVQAVVQDKFDVKLEREVVVWK